jgi:oxygen-independent coproporphyrinogen-3 oxidase
LNASQLMRVWEALHQHFNLAGVQEVTLEANPDDLSPSYLAALRTTPINRLSIGIQSFVEEELRWMRRAHTAQQARQCVPFAQDAGFENLTIDLIYATPNLTLPTWERTLHQALALGAPHISAYALTAEPGTALGNWVRDGRTTPAPDSAFEAQFRLLSELLGANGFEHYEISNLAKPGYRAQHNSSYWAGAPYLGLGPSAHGYLPTPLAPCPPGEAIPRPLRYANAAHNAHYIQHTAKGQLPPHTLEWLSPAEEFNEWVMTRLRLLEGLPLGELAKKGAAISPGFPELLSQWVARGSRHNWLVASGHRVALTTCGRMVADGLAAELFLTDPDV